MFHQSKHSLSKHINSGTNAKLEFPLVICEYAFVTKRDRISDLSDEIMCHILSFLPTKEAVATSILSKRWKPLWRSVPTLDFDDNNYHGYCHFVESVYAVILSRDFNQSIIKFRLCCSSRPSSFNSDYTSIWVYVALQRRVEHLDISFPSNSFIKTPSNLSFLSCRTLVVLKLKGLELKPFSSVDLPFLKVLHLQSLLLSDRAYLVELLSGCPVLEDLKAGAIYFKQHVTDREFNTLPKLVRAEISSLHINSFLLKVVNNVHFLQIHEVDFSFPYNGRGMFHNLTHVELVYDKYSNDWFEVVKFLKYCPKLQVLVIKQPKFHRYEFDELDPGDWQCPPSVPKCILLHLKECYLNDYRGTKGEFQFARYIMRNGRFLKRMTICSNIAMNQREKSKNTKKLSSCMKRRANCKLYFI